MSDLDEAGRAMIALAGDAHDPTDADRARVRAALAGRLGAAAGLGLGTAAVLGATATAKAAAAAGGVASAGGTGAAVAAAATGSTLAMKLVGVAVAITTAVGVGATVRIARRSAQAPAAAKTSELHGGRRVAAAPPALPAPAREQATSKELSPVTPADDPAPNYEAPSHAAPDRAAPNHAAPVHAAPVHAAPVHAVPVHAAPGHVAPVTAPTLPPPAAPTFSPPAAPTISPEARGPAKIEARDVTETDPHRRSVTPASANDHGCPPAFSGANPAARRSGSAVADEARLVHDGVRARRAGLPACALSLLDTHASHYPEGVLAEEREAERALALADLGRLQEARSAAAAFLRKHPASPLGMRLRHRIPGLGE